MPNFRAVGWIAGTVIFMFIIGVAVSLLQSLRNDDEPEDESGEDEEV